jgi:hypothetical protein
MLKLPGAHAPLVEPPHAVGNIGDLEFLASYCHNAQVFFNKNISMSCEILLLFLVRDPIFNALLTLP